MDSRGQITRRTALRQAGVLAAAVADRPPRRERYPANPVGKPPRTPGI